MTTDVYAREQRLRKQAELKSLYTNLASLRERGEASYMESAAVIPERLVSQINEARQEINKIERELLTLRDETVAASGYEFYRQAFEAEQAGDAAEAIKLYKKAARYAHPDANAALRSLRYTLKLAKNRPAAGRWSPEQSDRTRFGWLGLAILLIVVVVIIFTVSGRFAVKSPLAAAVEATATFTPTVVILIIPDTATPTPLPTAIPTATPLSTPTATPTPTLLPATATPTPVPALRPAPKVIGPKEGLVWQDGAIVFEFEDMHLAYNELYCLNTLRGYDKTNTENWSHPSVGRKQPAIPIEANVFRVAKQQGIRCVIWSAAIGRDSCDYLISQSTTEHMIGLPQVCVFR